MACDHEVAKEDADRANSQWRMGRVIQLKTDNKSESQKKALKPQATPYIVIIAHTSSTVSNH